MTRIINPTIFGGGGAGGTLLGGEVAGWCATHTDDATDWIGSYDGTFNGGMGTIADTGAGGTRAYDFDGTDDYISTTSAFFDIPASSGGLSVSLWAKRPSASNAVVIGQNDGNFGDGWIIYPNVTTGRIRLMTEDDTGNFHDVYDASIFPNATWTHIVIVYDVDASEIRSYYDDVLARTQTLNALWSGTSIVTKSLAIGRYEYGASLYFTGQVDNVRIYNKAISTGDISSLYDSGSGRGF